MKWFKYLTNSLNDPDISELIKHFGSDGYLLFFGTLELLSRDFDVETPAKSTFDLDYLKENLRLSKKKITKILHFLNEKPEKKRRIISDFTDIYKL